MISLVIPVYKNALNIPPLLGALKDLAPRLNTEFEVVLVVDGSPDDSHEILRASLPGVPFRSQLLLLSRNFGAFAAIRAGLAAGRGDYFAVMAADLQESPDLVIEFLAKMRDGAQVVVGRREGRGDPLATRMSSSLFWWLYRRTVQPDLPEGGVDVFGCTREVRDQIVRLPEQNSSLVGLLYWVGFRRAEVPYQRRAREIGKSAWTLRKKFRYLTDSIFGFTDLPIRLLTGLGLVGLLVTFFLGAAVIVARLTGLIEVPGYAPTVLLVMFFGTLNCFGLGVVGGYVWRGFENSKQRPNYIVADRIAFEGGVVSGASQTAPVAGGR